MATTSNEGRIHLAMEAMKRDNRISIREAAKVFNVSRMTLARRLQGCPARRDTTPKSKKLTMTKEQVIVDFILDLDARAFPPRLCGVEDIANILL